MYRILVVEDDVNINNMIYEALSKYDLTCIQAFSGTEAKFCMKNERYDLILLDLMLPGLNGDEFLKELRTHSKVPVIIVSAKDELDSKVDLLMVGADDYITKPFEIKELVARVFVQLRRENNETLEEVLTCKDLMLNKSTFVVCIKENELSLTKQEFKIMELLITHPNRVFTKQDIYDYAWDDFFIGEDKTINVHISNIRNKLKKFTDDEYIETVWGIGFRLKL
jgi:DNA-binding response OmpR family regulator